jgi:TatD DNase family protein
MNASALPALIDSHCHLNYDYAPKTAPDLIREARDNGVVALLTIGVDLETLPAVQAISEQYPGVYHTVGVHPHDAQSLSDSELDRLEQAARHPKCRAIGEIGLDYYYDQSPREIQRLRLEQQLDLALKLKLPIVVHSRDGEEDLLPALARFAQKSQSPTGPGVIHCFTGSEAFGRACLDLGYLISFSGILTFKNAENVKATALSFPLEKLLVETDAPFLAPIPFRGKKCEPRMVRNTAEKLAELRGVSIEELARVTTANARHLFRMEESLYSES